MATFVLNDPTTNLFWTAGWEPCVGWSWTDDTDEARHFSTAELAAREIASQSKLNNLKWPGRVEIVRFERGELALVTPSPLLKNEEDYLCIMLRLERELPNTMPLGNDSEVFAGLLDRSMIEHASDRFKLTEGGREFASLLAGVGMAFVQRAKAADIWPGIERAVLNHSRSTEPRYREAVRIAWDYRSGTSSAFSRFGMEDDWLSENGLVQPEPAEILAESLMHIRAIERSARDGYDTTGGRASRQIERLVRVARYAYKKAGLRGELLNANVLNAATFPRDPDMSVRIHAVTEVLSKTGLTLDTFSRRGEVRLRIAARNLLWVAGDEDHDYGLSIDEVEGYAAGMALAARPQSVPQGEAE